MNNNKTKDLEIFYNQFAIRKYKKGEILIRADDEPQGIFCLTKGYIRKYVISNTGFEFTHQILKPVSYFAREWAINGTPNYHYFEALTDSEVRRAPRDQVVDFIKDKPPLLFHLVSELLEENAETLTRVENLVFNDANRRVISILLYLGKHFGEKAGDTITIQHRFTQQDIATLVGIARETTNNEMVKLEADGLIKRINKLIVLVDFNKLEAELSSDRGKTYNGLI